MNEKYIVDTYLGCETSRYTQTKKEWEGGSEEGRKGGRKEGNGGRREKLRNRKTQSIVGCLCKLNLRA